jgi:hypothetical protein
MCWSVAASTGTADEASRDSMIFGRRPQAAVVVDTGNPVSPEQTFGPEDAIVSLLPSARKGSYSLRYHVPPRPMDPEDSSTLEVRYLVDDADLARVVVVLKKYHITNPSAGELAQIVAVFDSNDQFPVASPEFQTNRVDFDDELTDDNFAYFIEALLISNREPPPFPTVTAPGSPLRGPAIAGIRICTRFT